MPDFEPEKIVLLLDEACDKAGYALTRKGLKQLASSVNNNLFHNKSVGTLSLRYLDETMLKGAQKALETSTKSFALDADYVHALTTYLGFRDFESWAASIAVVEASVEDKPDIATASLLPVQSVGAAKATFDLAMVYHYDKRDTFPALLHAALAERGVSLWNPIKEQRIGDSRWETLNKALQCSRYTLVVITPEFWSDRALMQQLKAVFSGEARNANRILPILHGVHATVVELELPAIADRVADSSSATVEQLAARVEQALR